MPAYIHTCNAYLSKDKLGVEAKSPDVHRHNDEEHHINSHYHRNKDEQNPVLQWLYREEVCVREYMCVCMCIINRTSEIRSPVVYQQARPFLALVLHVGQPQVPGKVTFFPQVGCLNYLEVSLKVATWTRFLI